jgi:hypothetical protein
MTMGIRNVGMLPGPFNYAHPVPFLFEVQNPS